MTSSGILMSFSISGVMVMPTTEKTIPIRMVIKTAV